MSTARQILLGDLSHGAYVKLALARPMERPEAIDLYGCSSLNDFQEAIMSFLADNGEGAVLGAAFSTSGWEVNGQIDLVHYGFSLKRGDLNGLLGTPRISVVNNYVARALAIPVLQENERQKICGDAHHLEDVIAVVGPTTGLGCAFLAPNGTGGWVATHCEGGHADFSPRNPLEIEILKLLTQAYGHVSWERVLSAPGLVELWRCLAILDGDSPDLLAVDEILAQAYAGNDRGVNAIRLQTEIFASLASDFALMTGARGGIYLSGSHFDDLGTLFDEDVFTRRFYDKGRVSSFVKDIPVYRMQAEAPEILGVSTLFDDL